MKTLKEINEKYRVDADLGIGDKGSVHSYIDHYERLLAPYRNGCTFLEIGINQGHSLKMFSEYFFNSHVIGVDIWEGSANYFKDKFYNCQVIIGDATTKLPELENIMFDVVIDDGSHWVDDQVKSFQILSKQMNKGGIYIIEDILDLESQLQEYRKLGQPEIIDMRNEKGRFDDVLVVYRF